MLLKQSHYRVQYRRLCAAALLALTAGCSAPKPETGNAADALGVVGNVSADDKITKAAQDKIDLDKSLKKANVKAVAKGGQVELTGAVDSIADKDHAEELVREAIKPFSSVNAGVRNNLTIVEASDPGANAASGKDGK